MYNPDDDKELDRLSREAAGNYEPPGHASWETLSQELDKILPAATEKKGRRRFFYWWLLPCLLVAGGIYWSAQYTKSGTVVGSQAADKSLQKSNTTTIPGTNNVLSPSDIGRQAISPSPSSKTASSGNDAARNSKTDRLLHSDIAATTTKTGTSSATDQPSIQSAGYDRIIANNNVQSANTDTTIIKKDSDSITATITASTTDTTTNNLQQPKASKRAYPSLQSRFSISVLTGVDISTVKFRYASDIGYTAGFLGGYHFNNRWSLHTGVIYTKKNYKMAGSDFTAPKGTAPSYWALETVEGYCQMWEIPLLMRYSFVSKTNRRFFVSTGLSSYFMTKESYDYYYPFNNRIVMRNGTYNSGEKYLLSIAHFSAGIEQHVGKNLSMLIEPYAKIPVSGVGFGNIKLSSLGVNLALQYRPSRRQ